MVQAVQHDEEGKLTRQIEVQTSKAPSISFLTLAIGSMAVSAGLAILGRKETANFVGLWVPSILVIGLYNKLVKVEKELGATYH